MDFLLTIFSFAVNSPGSSCRAKWRRGGASLRQPRRSPRRKSPPSPRWDEPRQDPRMFALTRVPRCVFTRVPGAPVTRCHSRHGHRHPPRPHPPPPRLYLSFQLLRLSARKGFFSCNLDVSFQKGVNTFSATLGRGKRNNKRVEKDSNGR